MRHLHFDPSALSLRILERLANPSGMDLNMIGKSDSVTGSGMDPMWLIKPLCFCAVLFIFYFNFKDIFINDAF